MLSRPGRPSVWRNLPYLLRRTVLSAIDDDCFTIAKGAAYSSLLSFFPVLTSAAAILIEARAQFVQTQISSFLSAVLPPGTEQVVSVQLSIRGGKPVWLLIAADILAVWAGSSVIKSLIDGFHSAYRVPKSRPFLQQTAVAILLLLGAALPLLAASALLVFGQDVEGKVLQWFRIDPILTPLAQLWELLSRIARFVVAIFAMVSLTTILYYFGPYRKQRVSLVFPGAVLATALWVAATVGFGWYIRHVSNYNVLYGSLGTGIALLVWMYLLCAIAILGCEFNAEYERMISFNLSS